jgi:hypothetical protein
VDNITAVVPEPAAATLLGIIAVATLRRRRAAEAPNG